MMMTGMPYACVPLFVCADNDNGNNDNGVDDDIVADDGDDPPLC